jgi:hypothetical protein
MNRPTGPRIPRTGGGDKALNSRALMLNAIFRNNWPANVARPTLTQVRLVLTADAAMTRAQQARNDRIAAEESSPADKEV